MKQKKIVAIFTIIPILLCVGLSVNIFKNDISIPENNINPISSEYHITQDWFRYWDNETDDVEYQAYDITADDSGVYIVGEFLYEPILGKNVFVLKYSHSGEFLWNITWGSPDNTDYGRAIKADGEGNVYFCGKTSSFDNYLDAYLAKIDASSGTLLWNKTWGGASTEETATDLVIDHGGNITIFGETENSGDDNIYLAQYNESGNLLWDDLWNVSGWYEYSSFGEIIVDSSDNLYFSGRLENITEDPNPENDIFLTKYTPNGNLKWNTSMDLNNFDMGTGLCIDDDENIWLTGVTDPVGPDPSDIILLKYNSKGNLLYNDVYGNPLVDECRDIIFYDGNLILTGITENKDVDNLATLLLMFDKNLNIQVNTTWDQTGDERATRLTVFNHNLLVCGYSTSFDINFDATVVKFRLNRPPSSINIYPRPNETNLNVSVKLQVQVKDIDVDLMNVSFYNHQNNQLLGNFENVANGTLVNCTWSGLEYETSYSWYINITDGDFNTTSSVWTFTTKPDPTTTSSTTTDDTTTMDDTTTTDDTTSEIKTKTTTDTSSTTTNSSGTSSESDTNPPTNTQGNGESNGIPGFSIIVLGIFTLITIGVLLRKNM